MSRLSAFKHGLLATGLVVATSAHALEPMDEPALAAVSGGEGLTIDLQLRLAADAAGNRLGEGMRIALHDPDGKPDTARALNWCIFFCARNPEYLGASSLVIDGIYGAVNLSGLTVDSDGEQGLVVGLPHTLEVPHLSIGFIRAESPGSEAPGATLGALSIEGSFNMTGGLRVWGH